MSHSRTLERENKNALKSTPDTRAHLSRSERPREEKQRPQPRDAQRNAIRRRMHVAKPMQARACCEDAPAERLVLMRVFSPSLSPHRRSLVVDVTPRRAGSTWRRRGRRRRNVSSTFFLSFLRSLLCPSSQRHVLLLLLFCLFVCPPPAQPHKFRPERSRHGMRATRLFPTISPPSLPSSDPAVSPCTMTVSRSAASR